ncbi:UDP-glucuronosyltransferase 2C1-like [Acanthaster planci]|uniref:UDP-glucuronosyltransferase 2C1-like n=1 Tax=Acanthaster planci TaxID=133434 RepID=A0A8B7YF85_ACAPL|nr:UDP-glucuronosyltransferase 2C1-like [Acanthaster planci]
MNSALSAWTLLLMLMCFSAAPLPTGCEETKQDFKKYKFLYYSFEKLGSHGMQLSQSGKVLARQGHDVFFLVGSDGPRAPKTNDNDLFSFIFFQSNYTTEGRRDVFRELSHYSLSGELSSAAGIARLILRTLRTGKPLVIYLLIDECDALLRDEKTMARLRREQFDMMVADDFSLCNAIVAEALDIPFVQLANWCAMPDKYGPLFRVPTDPSYIPAHQLGFTDRMTLSQRVINYIFHWTSEYIFSDFPTRYQQLKVKYNIKPEVHITESLMKARLWVFNMNYPLEFPRPMQPNTLMYASLIGGKRENYTLRDDVAKFVDEALAGFVIFSLGSHVEAMEVEQAQMFADGFALLPQKVLWQSNINFTGLNLGENTKMVNWIPLLQLLSHKNAKAFVTQCGINSVQEALWAGLPIVSIPLLHDMFDNNDRAVARGFALSLGDITSVTSDRLRDAVVEVVNNPKYRKNAQHYSAILRDLVRMNPPAETIANWILHVTKFGGNHLRPAVFDLNFVQRNLIDVYLILLLVFAVICGANVLLWYTCCSRRRGGRRPKRD